MNFPEVSAPQLYLRAGWSLGNVQDRYLFAGAGGDQIVGRIVSGLPLTGESFSVLPPHFSPESLEVLREVGWVNILEGYDRYPTGFKRALPYLLASLLYHIDYLRENLSSQHPIWSQRMTTLRHQNVSFIEYFQPRVIHAVGHSVISNLRATGLPTTIVMKNTIRDHGLKIDELQHKQDQSTQVLQQYLKETFHDLPKKLKEHLLENFTIQGVIPINRNDIADMLDLRFERFERTLNIRQPEESKFQESEEDRSRLGPNASQYFTWGGRMGRLVPEGYIFPSTDVKTTWDIWHYGVAVKYRDRMCNTYPLKRLREGDHMKDIPSNNRFYVTRALRVLSQLLTIIHEQGLLNGLDVQVVPRDEADNAFLVAFESFIPQVYGPGHNPLRPRETAVATLANRLYKNSKRKRDELENRED